MKGQKMARKPQVDKRTGPNVTSERKAKVAKAQADRRQRLTEAAQKAGYTTIDELAAAILAGEVTITAVQSVAKE